MINRLNLQPGSEPMQPSQGSTAFDSVDKRIDAMSATIAAGVEEAVAGLPVRDNHEDADQGQSKGADRHAVRGIAAPAGDISEVNEAEYRRMKREAGSGGGKTWASGLVMSGDKQSQTSAPSQSFLSGRRDILTRDNATLLARKRANQAEIARLRAENVQLTQSIRANEDALDRLLENEG